MKKIEVSEAALDTLQRMVEELQAERDAFEKDALRYRWIKQNAGFGIRKNQVTELSIMLSSMPGYIGAIDSSIDSEIDG